MSKNLPLPSPRGLNREQAAEYIGIGTTFFDKLVSEGTISKPITLGARKVWDRAKLDAVFDQVNDESLLVERNPFDK